MNLNTISVLFADASTAAAGGQADPWHKGLAQMFPFVLMIVVFYLFLIRPQQKKAKEHENLLKTLRPNDKVLTNSGIVATVITVKEKTVTIRSADTKLEILKSAITEITERSAEVKES